MSRFLSEEDQLLMVRLRASGLVDGLVLDELVAMQEASWKPFGRIAVELGLMKIVQVAKVLSFQATQPGKTFGAVARILGFLRTSQVDEILRLQRSVIPTLAELLVSEMVLEPGEMAEVLHDVFSNHDVSTHETPTQ